MLLSSIACMQETVADRTDDREDVPTIIFDTDFAADCDDAGALAVLHALIDNGEAQVIGMMTSIPTEHGAAAIDAINTYYGRPDIPIGVLRESSEGANTGGLKTYNQEIAYRFENDLRHSKNAPSAVVLYRNLLSSQPDNAVTILTVGPLTNIYHLMQSSSDSISALDGLELIRKKVKRIVIAGGRLPEGSSYNFWISPEKAEYVINNWPAEAWFVPNQLGDSVLTGNEFIKRTTIENPARMAYTLYKGKHPDRPFRPSWDQMGVYVATRGTGQLFSKESGGSVHAKAAKIKWISSGAKPHIWFKEKADVETRRAVIEELMSQAPRRREP